MDIKDYFKFTGDEVIDIESMSGEEKTVHKTLTKFGNILYWQTDGNVIFAEWKTPQGEIHKLDEEGLSKIAGEYYLKSYAENMGRKYV